jgi:hypothetical protein
MGDEILGDRMAEEQIVDRLCDEGCGQLWIGSQWLAEESCKALKQKRATAGTVSGEGADGEGPERHREGMRGHNLLEVVMCGKDAVNSKESSGCLMVRRP